MILQFRKVIFSVLLSAIATILYSEDTSNIDKIIKDFRSGDREAIVSDLAFPIKRQYPLPSISDREFAIQHFDEIFDQELLQEVKKSSSSSLDWQQVGWRGICLGDGDLWLNSNGKIFAIGYQTEIERREWQKLVDSEKEALPPELRDFDMPISFWKTKRYVVRVDDINYKSRLILWKIDDLSQPYLVLFDGKMNQYGTIGTYNLDWTSGEKVYRVQENMEIVGEVSCLQVFLGKDLELNMDAEPALSEGKLSE